MKKSTTNRLLLMFAFCFYILSSCSKADVQDQFQVAGPDDITIEDAAKPGHHNNNPCHHNHHQGNHHHNNCNCCCPTTVAMATSISYYLDFNTDPQQVGIGVDVFYTNPGPQGTFRVVLKTSSGDIDSISVLPANHTNGQGGVIHLDYWVAYNSFPCTLQVNGRPANLRCDTRSRKTFIVDNNVNRK